MVCCEHIYNMAWRLMWSKTAIRIKNEMAGWNKSPGNVVKASQIQELGMVLLFLLLFVEIKFNQHDV